MKRILMGMMRSKENITKVLVNGPVNSGTSTFIKYLVNNLLLNELEEIFVLDCDPGRPIYTLPGCVSLMRATGPILTNNIKVPFEGVEILSSEYVDIVDISTNHEVFY